MTAAGVWPITADQAADALEGCAERDEDGATVHCYLDLGDTLAGADWPLADAVALARRPAGECVFTAGPQMHDLAIRLAGVMYRFRAWKPAEPCACSCSCWSRGPDGLCDACRMNIHADDRPRPRPVLVAAPAAAEGARP